MGVGATPELGTKPEPWDFEIGRVASEWQWVWRKPLMIMPLFYGAAAPFDYVSRRHATSTGGTPTTSGRRQGLSVEYETDRNHAWTKSPAVNAAVDDITVAALVTPDTTTRGDIFSLWGGANQRRWNLLQGTTANRYSFYVGNQATLTPADSDTNFVQFAPTFIVGTFKNPDIKIYEDGALRGTGTLASSLDASTSANVVIGSNASGDYFNGRVTFAVMLGEALNAAQIRAWSSDPFGPFRQRRGANYFVPAVVAGGGLPAGSLASMGVGI